MSGIRTNAAAVMLGVSPNTLRSWERRFGYPSPARTPGGHRQYDAARDRGAQAGASRRRRTSPRRSRSRASAATGPPSSIASAPRSPRFDEEKAERAAGGEPRAALARAHRRGGAAARPSPSCDRRRRGQRRVRVRLALRDRLAVRAAPRRAARDARRGRADLRRAPRRCDLDALHVQALELMLRRAGLRTLVADRRDRARRVSAARCARCARTRSCSAARRASLDAIGRLVYAVRSGRERRSRCFDFGGALPDTGASTVRRLGDAPLAARDALLERARRRAAAARSADAAAAAAGEIARCAAGTARAAGAAAS